MQRESFKTKAGTMRYRPVLTEEEYRHETFSNYPGFCLDCGTETDGVEPDARAYRCESCGFPAVYGLEELLMMGLLRFTEAN